MNKAAENAAKKTNAQAPPVTAVNKQPVAKKTAKTRASLAETAQNMTSLVQKSNMTLNEQENKEDKIDIIPKIAGMSTGPGPAATAIGNPKPTAAIAKPIVKKKDSSKPANPAPVATNSTSVPVEAHTEAISN